ncbi:DNA-binding protein HU-beta [Candidatus Kryptobacter tengchongensis]|uniref:DNA-binding protein HU-beta n=1 Tax=Kryptobacter tengchongensis TaxID=1643429 RepID=A0A656D547_KRYT1|nr:HU family DNA-binding protein [Candidatus Kryptobacter tengchongensis]CUS77082.1 DNA-binding protein HU-beta [Candidatus Kryptobacter tengchongensis]CUS98290.1 DNA-binding protein HU-beta [Candidatus Kryptobacter tengchongensis]CUT00059.1 DNA-binding protein HU-beta [Candidatus Kryptobacter tengchongensis]CUU00903.1 DNA-binding protein HU-beta [Candidatus Kryptobacter tengchongensis]CUU08893.1 DNA-binding protein HU-beta [Candidatus Kryptobacter tengchongensis]
MTKDEFTKLLAKDMKWSVAKTERVLDAFFNLVSEILIKEKKLNLFRFGVFTVKHRASRKGRNPKTGEELILPPKEYPYFKPSKSIISAINNR